MPAGMGEDFRWMEITTTTIKRMPSRWLFSAPAEMAGEQGTPVGRHRAPAGCDDDREPAEVFEPGGSRSEVVDGKLDPQVGQVP
jgi:hypothetical protein